MKMKWSEGRGSHGTADVGTRARCGPRLSAEEGLRSSNLPTSDSSITEKTMKTNRRLLLLGWPLVAGLALLHACARTEMDGLAPVENPGSGKPARAARRAARLPLAAREDPTLLRLGQGVRKRAPGINLGSWQSRWASHQFRQCHGHGRDRRASPLTTPPSDTGTSTDTGSGTDTGTPTDTGSGTGTGTRTVIGTGSLAGRATETGFGTFTSRGTGTVVGTFSGSGTRTGVGTFSGIGTQTVVGTFSGSGTRTGVGTFSGIGTFTGRGTATGRGRNTSFGTDTATDSAS